MKEHQQNEGEREDPAVSHENNPSWSEDGPKETINRPLAKVLDYADSMETSATYPPTSLPFHSSYMREGIPEINVDVQLPVLTISQIMADLTQYIRLAH